MGHGPDISRELRWLGAGRPRRQRLAPLWMWPVIFVFLLPVFAVHAWLAGRWAAMAGVSLGQVWREWANGIAPGHAYSGAYLMALEQLDKCALFVAFAVFGLVMWPLRVLDMRRKERLLAYIEATQQAVGEGAEAADLWPPPPHR